MQTIWNFIKLGLTYQMTIVLEKRIYRRTLWLLNRASLKLSEVFSQNRKYFDRNLDLVRMSSSIPYCGDRATHCSSDLTK